MNDKTTTHKDNNDSNLRKRQSANSSTMKKEVFIIGDSIIIYVNEREVSCKNSVKVFLDQQKMTSLIISNQLFTKKPNW